MHCMLQGNIMKTYETHAKSNSEWKFAACAARWETERLGSPRTEVNCTVTHCVYQNLWYNNGRFFLLVDGPDAVVSHCHLHCKDLLYARSTIAIMASRSLT